MILPPAHPFTLKPTRVHEAEGPGRCSFAPFQTLSHPGTVLWVMPERERQRLMPRGLPVGLSECLLLTQNETDLLLFVEKALCAASVVLVIAEAQQSLSLWRLDANTSKQSLYPT